jgi:hypothetical protein
VNPLPLLAEVAAVVVANYIVAWVIVVVLHGIAAWCLAHIIDRRGHLAERDRATLWLAVVLVPPCTALAQVAWNPDWLPWSQDLAILGDAVGGARFIIVATAMALLAIISVTWLVRARALRQLGTRLPARFPAVSIWQSLPERQGLRPQLTRSDHVVAPLVVGDDEIVLPSRTFPLLSPAQQRVMLAHEQAHLRHRDAFWLGIAGGVTRLLWFQPLARRAWHEAADAAEFAADEHAVAVTGGSRDLATGLVTLAECLPGLAPGLSAMGGRFEERVRRLVTGHVPIARAAPWRRCVVAAAVIGTLVLLPGPRVDPDRAADTIPWLAPSKDPPNARMLALRNYFRSRR